MLRDLLPIFKHIACFPVYSVSSEFKHITAWNYQTYNYFFLKNNCKYYLFLWNMLKFSSNIDCLQSLTSFSNDSCNSGAFLSIRSIWLSNHPHGVNDGIKQVLVLFQYTCHPRRTCMQDLARYVTWHNKTIVWKFASEKIKWVK